MHAPQKTHEDADHEPEPPRLSEVGHATSGQPQDDRQRWWSASLRGEVVTADLQRADRMWSRMRGLLGRRSLAASEGLWITPCPSIHMLGMRFAIDAVFLDEQHQVVRVFEDLRPGRMARGGKFARSVLELPQGKAAFFNIRVGDRLELAPHPSARVANETATIP
ncbi:MAG: DUF192 domain-containing protein [Thermoleophilia bacterium]|nr:DUF192 domain-containing protein [Thermoleophilia bacterium]